MKAAAAERYLLRGRLSLIIGIDKAAAGVRGHFDFVLRPTA